MDERIKRIIQITIEIVESKVKKGEVNPDNEAELRKATREAAALAREAYDAAIEFLF